MSWFISGEYNNSNTKLPWNTFFLFLKKFRFIQKMKNFLKYIFRCKVLPKFCVWNFSCIPCHHFFFLSGSSDKKIVPKKNQSGGENSLWWFVRLCFLKFLRGHPYTTWSNFPPPHRGQTWSFGQPPLETTGYMDVPQV